MTPATLIIVVFVVGYLGIAFEHKLNNQRGHRNVC